MNPKTQKKLAELGFTEDKPGHFTLSGCGCAFSARTKSERLHTIWMAVPCGEGYAVGWPLEDSPEAVEAGMGWFSAFVSLNAGRNSGSSRETVEKRR